MTRLDDDVDRAPLELREPQLEPVAVELLPRDAGLERDVLVADPAVARDQVEAELADVARLDVAQLARDEVVVEELHVPLVLPTAWTRRRFSVRGRSSPLQLLPTVVAAALYLRRTRTLAAARPARSPSGSGSSFWTGIALVVLALNSPIDALGEEHFFFMHMLQHVILGDLAPLCFVAGPDRADPAAGARVQRRRAAARAHASARRAAALGAQPLHLARPVPLRRGAAPRRRARARALLFFTCGCLMWEPVRRDAARRRPGSAPA